MNFKLGLKRAIIGKERRNKDRNLWVALIDLTTRIASFLRKNAKYDEIKEVPKEPRYFYEHGEFGEYPIFAFSSPRCGMYEAGFCTPCGYSNIAGTGGISKKRLYNAQISQAQYILDNFDRFITSKQTGILNKHNIYRRFKNAPCYKLQIAGNSSFFRDMEITRENRWKILHLFDNYAKEKQINLHIMLETRPEHLIQAYETGEFDEIEKRGLLKNLNIVVNMGFESVNEFSRNVIYSKNMELSDVKKSVVIAKNYGLDPSLFLFLGFHSMVEREIIKDVRESLDYLKILNVPPSLMIPNIQKYTINDLLYKYGRYNLIDPRTILEIVKLCLDFKLTRDSPSLKVDWFFGGLEAEPSPYLSIFNNKKNITCEKCSRIIHKHLLQLKCDYDIDYFLKKIRVIERCKCKNDYEKRLDCKAIPLVDRVSSNLVFADLRKEDYINSFL